MCIVVLLSQLQYMAIQYLLICCCTWKRVSTPSHHLMYRNVYGDVQVHLYLYIDKSLRILFTWYISLLLLTAILCVQHHIYPPILHVMYILNMHVCCCPMIQVWRRLSLTWTTRKFLWSLLLAAKSFWQRSRRLAGSAPMWEWKSEYHRLEESIYILI